MDNINKSDIQKKKCSNCTLMRSPEDFQRRGRIFKTCNKCNAYYISRRDRILKEKSENNNQATTCTSDIYLTIVLDKLFTTVDIDDDLLKKYKHIKSLQQILLKEVKEYYNQDSDSDVDE